MDYLIKRVADKGNGASWRKKKRQSREGPKGGERR